MICDNCKERDAVVHLTQIVENAVTQVHLCEKCAGEKGIETTVTAPKPALNDFLLAVQKQLPSVAADAGRCTFCAATLRDFRATGRLGCARCYTAFEPSLRDLLRRVHGNSRHAGKTYQPPELGVGESGSILNELRERLRRAVESEQFELAAKLRDQIKVLE